MKARITWISGEAGGRKAPPRGTGTPPYVTVVRFPGLDQDWPPHEAWSLIVEKRDATSDGSEWTADVRFLSDAAPKERLVDGAAFELYEGPRCVAYGIVLKDLR